jgi:hypothetical protein
MYCPSVASHLFTWWTQELLRHLFISFVEDITGNCEIHRLSNSLHATQVHMSWFWTSCSWQNMVRYYMIVAVCKHPRVRIECIRHHTMCWFDLIKLVKFTGFAISGTIRMVNLTSHCGNSQKCNTPLYLGSPWLNNFIKSSSQGRSVL